ncbi:MAG TPA: sensor histidine kinase [Candidatus Limnocylindrales bacterium]|nr:sensor histidine kinase [Candidatus Limnocylindrales bacterium]
MTTGRDNWERLLPLWHVVVAAGLSLTTISAWLAGDLDGPRLVAALVITGLLGLGYAYVFGIRTPGDLSQPLNVAYLLAWGVAYVVLLRLSPSYFWIQPVLYSQIFFLVEWRATVAILALFVALTLQYQVELSGGLAGSDIGELIGPVLTILFFLVLSVWIGKIIEESADRRELIERLESTRRELAERERQTAVLEERERVSRELHDTLAQDLIGIVTHLHAAEAASDPDAAARHRDEAVRMAQEGLAETRRLVWALRPTALEGSSLAESIGRTIERWRAANGIQASLTVTGRPHGLHPDVEVALLRSAQEGLANVVRHAGAREVTVSLSYLGDVVTLDVHDDGAGFDPDAVPAGPAPELSRRSPSGTPPLDQGLGLGLRGLRERAERLGGSVAVESTPGEGTTLGVTLPAGPRSA